MAKQYDDLNGIIISSTIFKKVPPRMQLYINNQTDL